MVEYEVIIVGGGTAGLRASIIAAKSGFNTALVEPGAIGGTCLNTGCIPTKTLLHAADLYNQMQDLDEIGLNADNVSFDFSKVMGRMRDIVNTGRTHAEESVDRIDNLTLYKGEAKFSSKNSVKVEGEELKAEKIIIATGASPWAPPIKGLEEAGYITNAGALELEELPESMVMIGGGYISCELASFFASLGCKVTILERLPTILSMLDDDVIEVVHKSLEKMGVKIHTNTDIVKVAGKNHDEVKVTTKPLNHDDAKETTHKADCLLVSTGRRPNTKGLELEKAGVKVDDKGYVEVNNELKTSNKNIYAIGDVNGKAPFAHAAKREARAVLENALLGKKSTINHDTIPWAVFTFPTIGGVGLSEKEAREQAKKEENIGVMKGKFSKVGKAKIVRETEGFVKVIYDKKKRDVLGAVIVGPDAHNLIHEFVVLMNTPKPKIDYIQESIHIHPTLAEVMEELNEV